MFQFGLRLLTILSLQCVARAEGSTPPGLRVQFFAVSRWANLQIRTQIRRAFQSCSASLQNGDVAGLLFFMGEPPDENVNDAQRESDMFGDIVEIGGFDSDHAVTQGYHDHLNVHEEAVPSTSRILLGIGWLLTKGSDLDYLVHMNEDSFINIPRMFTLIKEHANASLALGSIMQDSPLTIAAGTTLPCETCTPPAAHDDICNEKKRLHLVPGGAEYRVCLAAAQSCCPVGYVESPQIAGMDHRPAEQCRDLDSLENCVRAQLQKGTPALVYYGTPRTSRWFRGGVWVLGRRLVEFVGENVGDLKVRGMQELLLGFWLTAVEDVHFVNASSQFCYDVERTGNECSSDAVVVTNGMTLDHWVRQFNADTCDMQSISQ